MNNEKVKIEVADVFTTEGRSISLNEGDVLFCEGDQPHGFYVLEEGIAHVYKNKVLIDEAGVGSILGEMTLINDEPRAVTVVAKTSCRFTVHDQKDFFAFLAFQLHELYI